MLDFLSYPLGKLLLFLYDYLSFGRYAIAIILFTVIIRAILLPLNIKQYRSSQKMQEVQPMLQEIQKRYKNDKEKLNQEMMKIYQEHKVNPAGGCLPLLIQMPVLFALYGVISNPLKYMMGMTADAIKKVNEMVPKEFHIGGNVDISIINYFSSHKDAMAAADGLIKESNLINMHLFGLNMGFRPSFTLSDMSVYGTWNFIGLLLLVAITVTTTFLSIRYTTSVTQTQVQTDNPMANSMSKTMMYMMPVTTLLFSFQVPAGLILYWMVGNVLSILQQMFMQKFIVKKKGAKPDVTVG